jgi:hypothetical protein
LVAGATVGVALQAAITTARRTSIKTRIVFMINFTPLFLKEIGWMGKSQGCSILPIDPPS